VAAVSENPGLGASVSDLEQEPFDQPAAIASWLLGPLHLLGCQHGCPRPYPRPGRRNTANSVGQRRAADKRETAMGRGELETYANNDEPARTLNR